MALQTTLRARLPRLSLGFIAFWAVLAGSSHAQTQRAEPHMFAQYFACGEATAVRQDEIVRTVHKPIMDDAVSKAEITGWGWMVHEAGGQWRRVHFVMASGLSEVLAAQQRLSKQVSAKQSPNDPACEAIDAYVWKRLTGNAGTKTRGTQGFSTYYTCALNREPQVDALMQRVLNPMFSQLVADGDLVSWGWQARVVGGEHNRMLTMTSPSDAALVAARRKLNDLIAAEPLSSLLNEFCPAQVSYTWELAVDKR